MIPFARETITLFSDEDIIKILCARLRRIRRACCYSQKEMAQHSGVSISTIKRIEAEAVNDISISTIISILRTAGTMEGLVDMIEDVPESPLLEKKDGTKYKRCNSKMLKRP